MQNSRRAFAIYRRIIIGAALVMGVILCAASPNALAIGPALAFILLAVVIEMSPVLLADGHTEVTVTFPVFWAVVLLYGSETAALAASGALFIANMVAYPCAVLAARWGAVSVPGSPSKESGSRKLLLAIVSRLAGNWTERHDYPFPYVIRLVLYNASTFALFVGLSGLAYESAGGPLLTRRLLEQLSWRGLPGLLIPLAIGLVAYFTVDAVLFSAHNSVLRVPQRGFTWRSFCQDWRVAAIQYLPVTVRNDSLLMPFGCMLALLYAWWGPPSFAILLVPFFAVRHLLCLTLDQWRTYRDTITTMGTLMQHYHPYTRGHLRRVADLSERLARELGMPPRSVMLMPDAGMLHDIGKVGVSEEILDKVERLSDDEWEVIRSHPVKGANILVNLPYLDQIVDWVKYHHKWANGSGYPDDGRRDGDIPMEAAIIAVADAFDAMTDDREMTVQWQCDSCGYSPPDDERPDTCPQCGATKRRVYRKPLSLDEAIDQLRRGSGTQFKPEVVQAFLQMIDREGVRQNVA